MFTNRIHAGRRLAAGLMHLRAHDPVVLGLPRGGVPVAREVAEALRAPLDVIVVRKLGVPFQPELAMGAIGEGGVHVLNHDVIRAARVADSEIARVESHELAELERRARVFRSGRERVSIVDRCVVIVDDGIATGSTAAAACEVARAQGASRVVLAVPVAPAGWEARIGDAADEFVCVATPSGFMAIGQFYENFSQTGDDEVVSCLESQAGWMTPVRAQPHHGAEPSSTVGFEPGLEEAREAADGVEVYDDAHGNDARLTEREEAEGIELFEDPNGIIPEGVLAEGSPGHETLTGDQVGVARDAGDNNHDRGDAAR